MIIRISGSYSDVNSINRRVIQHKILLMSTTPHAFNKIWICPKSQKSTPHPIYRLDKNPLSLLSLSYQLIHPLTQILRMILRRRAKLRPPCWLKKGIYSIPWPAFQITIRSSSGARTKFNSLIAKGGPASVVSPKMGRSGKSKCLVASANVTLGQYLQRSSPHGFTTASL